jgi:predicted GIY-YIG superfamily endonuclease
MLHDLLLVPVYEAVMHGMYLNGCPYESLDPFDAPEACSWQAIRRERALLFPIGASNALSKPRARRTGRLHYTVDLTVCKIGAVKRDDLTSLPSLEPPPAVSGHAFVYMLVCSDGALYIGSTGNLLVRLKEHGGPNGAKFTRDHPGGRLVYFEGPFSIRIALQRERQLKRWSRGLGKKRAMH